MHPMVTSMMRTLNGSQARNIERTIETIVGREHQLLSRILKHETIIKNNTVVLILFREASVYTTKVQ